MVDDRDVESVPRAVLRELRVDEARAFELGPGVNVLVTGRADAALARAILEACRSSQASWVTSDAASGPSEHGAVARITRSELELRAARVARVRSHRAARPTPHGSEARAETLRARLTQLTEQADALVPELAEARERLARESDLRDRISVACDLAEFAMLDDAERESSDAHEALERLAIEWEIFEAQRATAVARNREFVTQARRAVDAASARKALSGAIGTIDAATMERIQELHQRHQRAIQLLETARRNQRLERARELEAAAAEEKAALEAAGLDSYSDFLMLRVRPPRHEDGDERAEADLANARRALAEATDVAREALAQFEAEEIELRAHAAALLGRLPGPDVAGELRDVQHDAHGQDRPAIETPAALMELASLCRQADLDTGTDPVATARAWLREPSLHALTVNRLESEISELERTRDETAAELESLEAPSAGIGAAGDGVESVTGAIRGLLSRGALVPNAVRSVDIDPPIVAALRDAIVADDRDARADGADRAVSPLLVEYPWEAEPDAIIGRMLSVFRDAAAHRQVIVIAPRRYPRPVPEVNWIDIAVDDSANADEASGAVASAPQRRWAGSLG